MKTAALILVFLLIITASALITKHILIKNRYEFRVEVVPYTNSKPSLTEPGLVVIERGTHSALFKIDRKTGKVWEYVKDFYYDPNQIVQTHGFRELQDNYRIYHLINRRSYKGKITLDDLEKKAGIKGNSNETRRKKLNKAFKIEQDETKNLIPSEN